jgi:AsmA protein
MIRSVFKLITFTFLGLALLFAAVLAAIPFLFPPEKYKPLIEQVVQKQTGRELAMKGPITFTLFPVLALKATDVSLSNAAGGQAKEMLSLSSLSIGVKLLPLLSSRLEVDDLILLNPVINLEVSKGGTPNWVFPGEAPPSQTTADKPAANFDIAGLVFSELKVINGTVSYLNQQTGDKHMVSNLNLEVRAHTLADPVKASGNMNLDGQNLEFALDLDNAKKLLDKAPVAVNGKVSLPFLKAEYKGTITGTQPPAAEGDLTLAVDSLAKVMSLLGSPPAAGEKDHSLTLSSPLSYKSNSVDLSHMDVSFDAIKASGSLTAGLGGKVPDIKANLMIPELDVTPYLSVASSAAPAADAPAGKELWSNTPIALGALASVDALIEASIGKITLPQTSVSDTAFTVQTKGGKLAADLKETKLYGGTGTAHLTADARGNLPAITQALTLQGVDIGKFLTDFGYTDKLTGQGDLTYDLNTLGRSEKEMVSNLGGNGSVHLYGAKFKGINLMNVINTINTLGNVSATFQNLVKPDTMTEVSDLTATFTVKDGVISNNDLVLKSPVGSATGEGEINLAQNLIRYRFTPKADVGLQNTSVGFKVPVVIQGSLTNPQIAPDTKKLITEGLQIKALGKDLSPTEKIEAVKDDLINLRKGVKGDVKGNIGGAINNLLGGAIPGLAPKQAPAPSPAPAQ